MADEKTKIIIELDLDEGSVNSSLSRVENKAKGAGKRAGDGFSSGFKQGVGTLDLVLANLAARLISTGVQAFSNQVKSSVDDLRNFGKSIAEVNTLLNANQQITAKTEAQLVALSSQFGTSNSDQIRGFYDIISAGVEGTSNQLEVLATANKAAVAGLSSVKNASKAIVQTINAYGLSASDAGDVSDKLFATVRAGITTFDELSNSIGSVNSTARAANATFGETFGALGFLTQTVGDTNLATTQLRSLFASIVKITPQAAAEAKKLGIQFNSARIQAVGLAQFMREVTDATRGNQASLAKLFPNVNALNAAIAFSSAGFEKFNKVIKSVTESSGDTARAFEIIAAELDFKIEQRTRELQNFFLTIAQTFEQTFGKAIGETIPTVEAFARSFIAVGTVINNFVIAPLELVFNTVRVVFNLLALGVQALITLLSDLGGAIATQAEKFGLGGPIIKGLKTFEEVSNQIFKNFKTEFGDSIDNVFQGSIFSGGDEFLGALQSNLTKAKSAIEESGIQTAISGPAGTEENGEKTKSPIVAQLSGIQEAFAGLNEGATNAGDNITKRLGAIRTASIAAGKAARDGLGRGFAAGFTAVGEALANGENALGAFGKTMLAAFGKIASQLGQFFILQGTALLFTYGGQAQGAAMIAAGAALSVFGGFLAGKAGGSSAALAGSSAADGGGIATSSDSEFSPETDPEERADPETRVTVNIQGDVFDTPETSLRIVDLLNEAFDRDGAVVTGIA